jgi:urease accessory protein UreE
MDTEPRITGALGQLTEDRWTGRAVDYVDLAWDEAEKRLLNKATRGGVLLHIHLAPETARLIQDDILTAGESGPITAVNILPADCLSLRADAAQNPRSALIRAAWECGNRHVRLFWGESEAELLTPADDLLQRFLCGLPDLSVTRASHRLDQAPPLSPGYRHNSDGH